jgi:dihydroorotate dehydrogenase
VEALGRVLYERIIRPLIFALNPDAERAHERGMRVVRMIGETPALARHMASRTEVRDARLERMVFGLRFRNPVGLAGGFDKNAVAIAGFEALGFGFIEIGTITRHPQPGNPKPRVFRLPADEAIINRFGFNNDGAVAVAQRLAAAPPRSVPLGISLGKSKITPLEEAAEDYLFSLQALFEHGDYFAVNISSPNTPGLRQLQDRGVLDDLLKALLAEVHRLALGSGSPPKPVLVKVAPDLTLEALDELLAVCTARGVAGIIATNTTLSRDGLRTATDEQGGLSGRPLHARALSFIRHIHSQAPSMPVVGVGGIFGADDAAAMLDAGASLLQVYTGFVYKGPMFVRNLNRGFLTRLGQR